MRIFAGRRAEAFVTKVAARSTHLSDLEPVVRHIVNDVRRHGDRALRRYAQKWDGLSAKQSFRVSRDELQQAMKSADPQLRESLNIAAKNIRQFCEWQMPRPWTRSRNGIALGQLIQPLESVGCYVPGGRYPLVSTVLMTVIPAQVAGVRTVRVVSPNPSAEVLTAASMLGVTEFYRIGGAQAIAALAYGTDTIPRVDKIVGPGNSYVTTAKKLVSFDCAIDFLAGPTEALIMSHSGNPEFIAADLVAQAEHDVETLAWFVTTSSEMAKAVAKSVATIARENSTAKKSLSVNGAILIADSRSQARGWANQLAPEHITVEEDDVSFIRHAGSVFVGNYSAQAAGDYASGPNHVLPTSGQARFRGGLSVLDFIKVITVQQLSRQGIRRLAPAIEYLARAEGLRAHAHSVSTRCQNA